MKKSIPLACLGLGAMLASCSGSAAGSSDLTQQITTLQQQVASLQAALTAETNRATAAETALGGQLSTLQTAGSGTGTRLTALETKTAALSAVTIAGQPAAVFSGVNVYVENGMGQTGTANGLGNLIVGYDERSTANVRTGSHNLVLGTQNDFSSWGGLVAGEQNDNAGAYSTITGGKGLATSAADSSVGPNDATNTTEFATITSEIGEEAARAESAEQTLTTNLAATNASLTGASGSLSSTETAVSALQTLTASMSTGQDPSGAQALYFSGVNVYVQNGAGTTNTTNGLGNLIVGYNELPNATSRGGSHNLVLGTQNNYASYGGLVAGGQNSITGKYATVIGGSSLSESTDFGSVGPNDGLYMSDIASLTTNLNSVTNVVNDASTGVAALNTALALTNNNVAAVTTTVNDPTTGVAALNTSLTTTNSNLASVTATVNDPSSGAAALSAALATTNANLATTNSHLATTNSNLSTTNTALTAVTSTVNDPNTGVAALNTLVNSLTSNTYEQGMIAYYNATACPTGWTAVASAQGRYIVGLNTSGTLAGQVGTALTNQEVRAVPSHNHSATDSGHQHFVQSALIDDRNFSGTTTYGQQYGVVADYGTYNTAPPYGNTTAAPGVFSVTGYASVSIGLDGDYTASKLAAPYIQFLVCQKN